MENGEIGGAGGDAQVRHVVGVEQRQEDDNVITQDLLIMAGGVMDRLLKTLLVRENVMVRKIT